VLLGLSNIQRDVVVLGLSTESLHVFDDCHKQSLRRQSSCQDAGQRDLGVEKTAEDQLYACYRNRGPVNFYLDLDS